MLNPVGASKAVSIDLSSPAQKAGFTRIDQNNELGATLLYVASQPIRVSYIEDVLQFYGSLDAWRHAVSQQSEFEQYLVVGEPSCALISELRALATELKHRKVEVGSYTDYCTWVSRRLGPFSSISEESPVRQMLEHLCCLGTAPNPSTRDPIHSNFEYSAIKRSFDLGAMGVQALATLLKHTRGASNFINLEADKAWQSLGVDLKIRASMSNSADSSFLNVEVKTENFTSGNITLEDLSNIERNTPGWLHYSKADVLAVCMWPTGEIFFLNFQTVREWALAEGQRLRVAKGKVPEQPYFSRIFLAPITTLMQVFPDTVYLSLTEWLPLAYSGQFKQKGIAPVNFDSRKLTPIRLTLPTSTPSQVVCSVEVSA